MNTLTSFIPDVNLLLELPPEELAEILLQLANEHKQNGLIHPQALLTQINGAHGEADGYPQSRRKDAELAFSEAWNWLTVHGLLVPDTDTNGNNGWKRLSRQASKLLDQKLFQSYARSVAFPKSLLRNAIEGLTRAWPELAGQGIIGVGGRESGFTGLLVSFAAGRLEVWSNPKGSGVFGGNGCTS